MHYLLVKVTYVSNGYLANLWISPPPPPRQNSLEILKALGLVYFFLVLYIYAPEMTIKILFCFIIREKLRF